MDAIKQTVAQNLGIGVCLFPLLSVGTKAMEGDR